MNLWWQARSNRTGRLLRGALALVLALTVVVVTMTGSMRMRRGGGVVVEPPPPPTQTYGPTFGAASVRAGAGPRTVTNPGGGISFNSSSSLQTAINASSNPSGSTFVCSTTTPTFNTEVNTGTKEPTIIFPGTVGQTVIDHGFDDRMGIILGSNTTLIGGTWQNVGTTFAFANMIHIAGSNVVVSDVVVHDAREKGIQIQGPNALVTHAHSYSNGRYSLAGGDAGDGPTIEFCEIEGGNTRNLDGGDAAGGTKFSNLVNGTFRFNYVHDNHGFGWWPDTGCNGWLCEENVMEFNHFAGLMYEANAASVIRRNYVANNGTGVAVGATPATFENCVNVRLSDDNCSPTNKGQFQDNLIDHTGTQSGTLGGLFLLWDHTGSTGRSAQNWDIHHNQFWLRGTLDQRVGGKESGTGVNAFPVWDSNNDFFSNQYRVASMTVKYWKWDDPNATGSPQGVAKSYAEWQAYHPGDNLARVQI